MKPNSAPSISGNRGRPTGFILLADPRWGSPTWSQSSVDLRKNLWVCKMQLAWTDGLRRGCCKVSGLKPSGKVLSNQLMDSDSDSDAEIMFNCILHLREFVGWNVP